SFFFKRGTRTDEASTSAINVASEMNEDRGGALASQADDHYRAQSQFLNFQDLSFHGVNVSSRHWTQRSGGQWLRRDVSLVSAGGHRIARSEEHTSELQSLAYLVCRLLLEKKTSSTVFFMSNTCVVFVSLTSV